MDFDFGSMDQPFEADWPVDVSVPVEGGRVSKQRLTVRYRLIPDAELAELGDGLDGQKTALRRVVVGFSGRDAPAFSEQLLEAMLDRAYVRNALTLGYAQFATGSPAKN